MAKPSLGNITTTQTFQNWFDKTNEVVDLIKSDVLTASAGAGDTTSGNATLAGTLTTTNSTINTLLRTNDIAARTTSAINFQNPITVTSSVAAAATFSFGSGGRVNFTDGSTTWEAGMEDSNPANFIIDTGTGQSKLALSTAGLLTVPTATVTGLLTVGSISIGGGGVGFNTDQITEGSTNLYYTDARARAAIRAQDLPSNIDADTVDGLEAAQFIRADVNDIASGNLTFSGTLDITNGATSALNVSNGATFGNTVVVGGAVTINNGTLQINNSAGEGVLQCNTNGNLIVAGDVTSAGTISDERLKENVVRLNNSLEKVTQINGYNFNFKDNPDETMLGVIAQEIEKVLPEVVYEFEKEDTTYKAVRYANIVPLLIEAIKDLKDKVDDLEGRINSDNNS
tara:strand:+ start:23 stop:1219 length:1197 start_codon:yes stop_codon:yes gene_type:complete